jgi:hypothetical protein
MTKLLRILFPTKWKDQIFLILWLKLCTIKLIHLAPATQQTLKTAGMTYMIEPRNDFGIDANDVLECAKRCAYKVSLSIISFPLAKVEAISIYS